MKTKTICFVALFSALLCVLAPISIPMVPVAITLGTLGVYIIGALLDWKRGPLVIIIYIVIGGLGLPVFSSYSGGLGKLVGPTGGYIFGYILCVLLQSIITTKYKYIKWVYPLSMIGGTALIYLFGTTYFMVVMDGKYTIAQALLACVIPFLIGDTIKIIIASIIGIRLRKRVDTFLGIPYEKEEKNKKLLEKVKE